MRKFKDYFWMTIKYAIIAFAIAFLVRGFLLIPVPVEGNSMETTLKQGATVIMEKISKIKRFDVVVFQLASGTTYIKRVVALPGDELHYDNDKLYVNGKVVSEPFLSANKKHVTDAGSFTNDFSLEELTGTKKLGPDSYFVMGDNRRISKDRRSFGAIKSEDILGKARFVYYPFKYWRMI